MHKNQFYFLNFQFKTRLTRTDYKKTCDTRAKFLIKKQEKSIVKIFPNCKYFCLQI